MTIYSYILFYLTVACIAALHLEWLLDTYLNLNPLNCITYKCDATCQNQALPAI